MIKAKLKRDHGEIQSMAKDVYIIKENEEREIFKPEKLRDSLRRAKASVFVIDDIVNTIERTIKDGMKTSDIYRKAYQILKKKDRPVAVKYSIKRSLMGFGPSGFPFEAFVAQLFRAKGYNSLTDQIVQGKCVEHEIDVITYNKKNLIMVEVKFHNSLEIKSDTKVALYVKARFDDLKDVKFDFKDAPKKMTSGIIVTNTKFTNNAIKYAECNDLGLIGWSYPKKGNLYDLISETMLHPITCLTQLPKFAKNSLIEKGVISCRRLMQDKSLLDSVGVKGTKKQQVLDEIKVLCTHEKKAK